MTGATRGAAGPTERAGLSRTARLVSGLLLVALAAGMAVPADAASTADTVAVDLAADGDATVSVVHRFDLSTEAEAEAFATLQDDRTARTAYRDRFEDRINRVAAATANATGRSMPVHDAAIDVRSEGDVGVVALSVEWDGLAATDGDRLVLTEPFASGFHADASLRVSGPDGAAVAGTEPAPTEQDSNTVEWAAGTSLDGFRTAYDVSDVGQSTTTVAGADQTTGGGGAGFTIAVGGVALAGSLLLVRRR